jgi:hypothetical protein
VARETSDSPRRERRDSKAATSGVTVLCGAGQPGSELGALEHPGKLLECVVSLLVNVRRRDLNGRATTVEQWLRCWISEG